MAVRKVDPKEFNDVPFIVLNRKLYDCQFGKNRKDKIKDKRKNEEKCGNEEY